MAIAALAATACGDDQSDAEKAGAASETLQKGLDAHVARSLYTQVISLDPGNAGAHLNLGFLYQDLGQNDDAQREFQAAVAIDPTLQSRIVGLDAAGGTTTTTAG